MSYFLYTVPSNLNLGFIFDDLEFFNRERETIWISTVQNKIYVLNIK
jgi:hypothetical protein